MKAIILISSIFYILGLKLSHTFDFVKKSNHVANVTTVKPDVKHEKSKCITLQEGMNLTNKKDSLQCSECPDRLQKAKI